MAIDSLLCETLVDHATDYGLCPLWTDVWLICAQAVELMSVNILTFSETENTDDCRLEAQNAGQLLLCSLFRYVITAFEKDV
jgi:hypothetical protein